MSGSVHGRSGLVGVFCQTLEAVNAVADEIKALLDVVDDAAADVSVVRYTSDSNDREAVLDALTRAEPRSGILVAVGTPGLATGTDCAGMGLSFHLGGRHLLDFLQASGRTNREGATVGVPQGPPVTSVGEVVVWNPPGYSSLLDVTRRSDAASLGSVSEHGERVPPEADDGLSTARDPHGSLRRLPPPEAPGVAHVGDFDGFTSMHARLVRRCRRKDLEATSDGALADLVRSCHDAHFPLCDVCSEHEAAQPPAAAGAAVDRPSRGPPPPPGGPDGAGRSSLAGLTATFAAASSDATARAAAAVVHQRLAARGVRYSASGLPETAEPPVGGAAPRTVPPLTGAEPPQDAAADA